MEGLERFRRRVRKCVEKHGLTSLRGTATVCEEMTQGPRLDRTLGARIGQRGRELAKTVGNKRRSPALKEQWERWS